MTETKPETQPENTIDIANFISDLRTTLRKHLEEAATAMKRIQTPGVLRPTTEIDQMWIAILAFHTTLVDWVIDEGIREDKAKASAMVDVGMRLFLDNVRDQFLAAESEKRKPKPNIIGLQS